MLSKNYNIKVSSNSSYKHFHGSCLGPPVFQVSFCCSQVAKIVNTSSLLDNYINYENKVCNLETFTKINVPM